jgi:hypothetical protein
MRGYLLAFAILWTWIVGCKGGEEVVPPEVKNEPPTIEFVMAPAEGDLLSTSRVELAWIGHDKEGAPLEYSYRVDSSEWSPWTKDTSLVLEDMTEGKHSFEVKARDDRQESQIIGRSFAVDAVKGPAVMLSPYYVLISKDQDLKLDLLLDDAKDVLGGRFVIRYDRTKLEPREVVEGDLFKKNGAMVAFLKVLKRDEGFLELDISALGGNPPTITGSGVVAKLVFKAIGSSMEGKISIEVDLRDGQNNPIKATGIPWHLRAKG